MARWRNSDDDLRAMYAGGRGNATAHRFTRFWAAAQGAGLLPRRWVTLEVVGRRTGAVTRFPLGMADWEGNWYLVSMLGNDCNWVRNVRAAGGLATIRHGRARARHLVEVPFQERAPILKRYLQKVPGARGRTYLWTATHPWSSSRRSLRATPPSASRPSRHQP